MIAHWRQHREHFLKKSKDSKTTTTACGMENAAEVYFSRNIRKTSNGDVVKYLVLLLIPFPAFLIFWGKNGWHWIHQEVFLVQLHFYFIWHKVIKPMWVITISCPSIQLFFSNSKLPGISLHPNFSKGLLSVWMPFHSFSYHECFQ